jgi:hypothetical protein
MPDHISVKLQGFDSLLKTVGRMGTLARKAAALAINDAAKSVKSAASRDIRGKFNIPKNRLDPRIRIGRATPDRLQAAVTMQAAPIPVSQFGARPVTVTRRPLRRGVSVAILKGAKRKRLKGAFLQTMKSGHVGVFVRKGKARLPIIERKVISPVSMWKDYVEQHMREAGPYLQRRMAAQLERLLKG